ncbi:uncharacterized protein FOMMEDRAFT_155800 [Fomitiporia mediterranea MF3/22]|uniref:uncharacterized protein n=1 Tax=Fomitiporia mediterranea (strain MF3/22) TaxID=694068 RepID=UPI0004407F8B|nr:uncharacterized protein FOMMEDRAFT_155800 [Fomitiporia mediterranea MF3/22]EJD04638.1 hypothetical protein FOMMEDRAFT_155800 [Fomitiporia mediterranea MF3/22]
MISAVRDYNKSSWRKIKIALHNGILRSQNGIVPVQIHVARMQHFSEGRAHRAVLGTYQQLSPPDNAEARTLKFRRSKEAEWLGTTRTYGNDPKLSGFLLDHTSDFGSRRNKCCATPAKELNSFSLSFPRPRPRSSDIRTTLLKKP